MPAWLVMLTLAAVGPAPAAVIVVDGTCFFGHAIAAANDDAASGGCPAGSGADTVHLLADPGPGLLMVPHEVTSDITLKGHGRTLEARTFDVKSAARLEVISVVFSGSRLWNRAGGTLGLTKCTVRGTNDDSAILNWGTMAISDSSIADNTRAASLTYGAIEALDGRLTIEGSQITSNHSTWGDRVGAMAIYGPATVEIKGSLIADNRMSATFGAYGGAITNAGTLVISHSTFANNRVESSSGSAFGGAISNGGSLTISHSTFSGNETISALSSARGGAIHTDGGSLSVTNSTFSGNEAAGFVSARGGAINSLDGGSITNSTILGNRLSGAGFPAGGGINNALTGLLTLRNSVLDGNTTENCGGAGYFLNGGNFGCFGDPTVTNVDLVLKDNGGQTKTHALLPGSNAIGAGAGCPLTDQRVVKRNAFCDSGAFELGGCPDDLHELEGSDANDNTCYGARIRSSGKSESHRFCDQDWIFFGSRIGSEYLIETSSLTGGANTLISAYDSCHTFIDSDDNGGPGLASRLSVTAGGKFVDVKVENVSGGYGPAKAYQVSVTCVVNCPCWAIDGETLNLTSAVVSGPEIHEVCGTITAGPSYSVGSTGLLLLAAGTKVVLGNGFSVDAGGELQIEIDPSLRPLD